MTNAAPSARGAQKFPLLVASLLKASPIGLRKTKEVTTRASEIEDLEVVIAIEERTQPSCMKAANSGQLIPGFGRDKLKPA